MKTFPIAMVLLLAMGCACRERVVTGAEEHSTDKPPDPGETIAVTARVKDLFPWEFMMAPPSVVHADYNLAELTVIEPAELAGKRMEVLTATFVDAFARTNAVVNFSVLGFRRSIFASAYPDSVGVFDRDVVGDIRVDEDRSKGSRSLGVDFELTGAQVSPTRIACVIKNVSKREIVCSDYGIGYFGCVELDYFDHTTKRWKRIPRDRFKRWFYKGAGVHRTNVKRIAPGAVIPHVRSATFLLPKELLSKYTFAIPLDKHKMPRGDNLRFRVVQHMGLLLNIEKFPIWRGQVVSERIEILPNQSVEADAAKPRRSR